MGNGYKPSLNVSKPGPLNSFLMQGYNGVPIPQSGSGGDYLGQYGLQQPDASNINPYLFFQNSGYLGDHPRLAGALDAGLSGLAFTHGGMTAGDSMSAVAQGILGSRQAHRENIINQYMAPYAMAQQLQQFQLGQKQGQYMDSLTDMDKAHANYFNGLGRQPAGPRQPMHIETRADGTYGIDFDPATGQYRSQKIDGMPGKPDKQSYLSAYKTVPERLAASELIDAGIEPDSPEWGRHFRSRVQAYTNSLASGAAGGRLGAQYGTSGNLTPQDQEFLKNQKDAYEGMKVKPGDFAGVMDLQSQGRIPKDSISPKSFNDSVDEAWSTYPAARAANPSLTFKQHFNSKAPSGRAMTAPSGSAAVPASPKGKPTLSIGKDGSINIGRN